MKVRRARQDDLDAIVRIDQASAGAAHWRREDYATMLSAPQDCLYVAENASGGSAGFVAVRVAADEAEILNLAVDPATRRRGAGRALLDRAIREASRRGARRLYLEVRASNEAARRFYLACAFKEVGGRPGYYQDPAEDAVLLARELGRTK